jgi:hypothetical protein
VEREEFKKPAAVEAIKRNLKLINWIVLLVVFTLFLINIKVLYKGFNFINPFSVASLLLIVACLVTTSFYIAKIISQKAIKDLERYIDQVNDLLLITKREIQERKEAQEKLKSAHDELEVRVKERTEELSKTVTSLQEQMTKRQEAEEQLEYQAFHDQLTHLPNRVLFTKVMRTTFLPFFFWTSTVLKS